MRQAIESDDSCRCSQFLLPGNVLGSYRIVELLGEGGMGRVYRAEHVRLGRSVALKILKSEYASNKELIHRFFAEAKAANQVDNENILQITDFVEDKVCQVHYIVMELLRGMDLLDLLGREGALPPVRIASIGVQIAGALGAAHDVEIIHRDLKPENIFLVERTGRKDFVKILDFGVAKLREGLDDSPYNTSVHQTSPGAMVGTPTYMSPEQACGKPVDNRSDIYSLGVILYEMATGYVPFEGKSFGELVIKHSVMPPPRPSQRIDIVVQIPEALERLILQCLEKDPLDRPQSMQDVKEELQAIASLYERTDVPAGELRPSASPAACTEPPSAPKPTPSTPPVEVSRPSMRESRLTPRVAWITAATLVLLIGGATTLAVIDGEPTPATPVHRRGAATMPRRPDEGEAKALARVKISIDSVPQGAEIWDRRLEKRIGTTPFVSELDRSAEGLSVDLRKQGFVTTNRVVTLDRDLELEVILEQIDVLAVQAPPAPSRHPAAPRTGGGSRDTDQPNPVKTSLDRRAVLDPFAELE